MNLSLEQRLTRVENKVRIMRALVTKMYQTFYAGQIRRANTYGRMLAKLRYNTRAVERRLPSFLRLARIASGLSRGRSVVTLDPREYNQLRALLKRKVPFRRRP
jgi:hypothetical protein